MKTHNPENERIKRKYARWLEEAQGFSPSSVDQALAAIHRFEADTKYRPFKAFHIAQAVAFKRRLADEKNATTGKPLSKSTLRTVLNANRKFVHWLAGQPGFRSRISYSDSSYFKLSDNDARSARAVREKHVASIEQIRHVLATMPCETDIQKRDRALIAFAILTGARDGAIASFRLKHIDLEAGKITHEPQEVNAKRGKFAVTAFFPVGNDIRAIVEEWIGFLKEDKIFGPDEPIFPATKMGLDANRQFAAVGLDRKPWSTTQRINEIFKSAFNAAGLPPSNPHSFRDTLAQLGERICRTPEEFKAWSQNLCHEKVMTTFKSYGTVSSHRQVELIARLGRKRENATQNDEAPDAETVRKVLNHLEKIAS